MIVCFCMEGRLTHDAVALAQIMVASVRKHMPYARIVQHSDMAYPETPGVDHVIRLTLPGDHVERRWGHMAHMMAFTEDNVLSLDCDVVVRRDLRDVFERDFDIAMCRTPDRRDTAYNAGVIFAKPEGFAFWQEVLDAYQRTGKDEWEDSQRALTMAADDTRLKVLDLNFNVFNFTPAEAGTDRSAAALVHYRGRRKRFMAQDNMELLNG